MMNVNGKHCATDRYLSRGGTVDAAVLPRLACTTSGIALTTVGSERNRRSVHARATFATAKKLPSRCWDCCHFSAPDRGGPERAVPNILNNEKVFTVF
jgi:hypothetical protein